MRVTSIFLLCAVGFICSSANAETDVGDGQEPACENYLLPACPRNVSPVCGTDGVTYGNECLLCVQKLERNLGIKIKKSGPC